MNWQQALGVYRHVERRETNFVKVNGGLQALIYDVTVVRLIVFWLPVWTWEFDR